jgi:membrane peptidoglycan carboxypeptidase
MNKPFIVKEILSSNNEVLDSTISKKIRQIISSQTAKSLTELLVNVVEQGTGIKAKVNNLK